jgi:anti-sigma regulatory factor (Ser/Thr protein kinase)
MRVALAAPTASSARDAVGRVLLDQSRDTADTAKLLTTELVANAIVHGGGVEEVIVERRGDLLRVEVADGNPALPTAAKPPPAQTSGRGLLLVAALATRWSAELAAKGKVVSFELQLR